MLCCIIIVQQIISIILAIVSFSIAFEFISWHCITIHIYDKKHKKSINYKTQNKKLQQKTLHTVGEIRGTLRSLHTNRGSSTWIFLFPVCGPQVLSYWNNNLSCKLILSTALWLPTSYIHYAILNILTFLHILFHTPTMLLSTLKLHRSSSATKSMWLLNLM